MSLEKIRKIMWHQIFLPFMLNSIDQSWYSNDSSYRSNASYFFSLEILDIGYLERLQSSICIFTAPLSPIGFYKKRVFSWLFGFDRLLQSALQTGKLQSFRKTSLRGDQFLKPQRRKDMSTQLGQLFSVSLSLWLSDHLCFR